MGKSTKKVGGAGRFGPRYGVKIRRQIEDIEKKQRKRHPCPSCGHNAVKRVSAGIWQCRHCNLKFAGGAYVPVPPKKLVFVEKEEEGIEGEEVMEGEGPVEEEEADV